MELRKIVKNLIPVLLILSLLLQGISYAATVDVNNDASDVSFVGKLTQSENLGYAAKPRGARVSIWNVEDKFNPVCERTRNVAMYSESAYEGIMQTYENISTFRCLSNDNKYDVAQLFGDMTEDMIKNVKGFAPDYLGNYPLNVESVPLPNMYATSEPAAERVAAIKKHFQDMGNLLALLDGIGITSEELEKWNEGKIALLVEPMMTIYKKVGYKLEYWMLTCAELGTLALDHYADSGAYFDIDKLQSTAFKRLPFGSFKDTAEAIYKIPPCPESQRKGRKCLTPADWADMLNFLGCFEIIPKKVATKSEATESEIDPDPPVPPLTSIDPNTEEMVLYEDELSYIYDYNSIDNTGVSRKLQCSV